MLFTFSHNRELPCVILACDNVGHSHTVYLVLDHHQHSLLHAFQLLKTTDCCVCMHPGGPLMPLSDSRLHPYSCNPYGESLLQL